MTDTLAAPAYEKAEQLPEDVRAPLRDLILALADSKRVLGLRYSDRMLGSPTLEAGIAASSMAQDEWGHARLTYALLGDLGDEPKALEHERPASGFRSIAALDVGVDGWPGMVAAALLVDSALSVQYAALLDSRYTPVHNRVQKLLDEERFHFQYAAGWARRIAQVPELRGELAPRAGALPGPRAGLAGARRRAAARGGWWRRGSWPPGPRRCGPASWPASAPCCSDVGAAEALGVNRAARDGRTPARSTGPGGTTPPDAPAAGSTRRPRPARAATRTAPC